MGCHKNITDETFPKQSKWIGWSVDVCFHYNTKKIITGIFVRDDIEDPYISIIKLSDGRHVLSTECQHSHPQGIEK